MFWVGYNPNFATIFFLMRLIWYIWPKLQQMFRKAWRRAHSDLIFCMMKIYTVSRKKAQNSDVEWGRLHGQIGVLRLQIVFFQISVHQFRWNICNIWQRSTRPFSSFSGFNYVFLNTNMKSTTVHFVPDKWIWNIWTRIKWGVRL